MKINKSRFGSTPDGHEAFLYKLSNDRGMDLKITNYGGAITSLHVPDRHGEMADVVLGYETLEEYVKNPRFFGALIGRFANRIALGKFKLDDVEFQLIQNNGPNHLHGGLKGFDKVVWQAHEESTENEAAVRLSYLSKDGEEGYPGNLTVNVSYIVYRDNELRIEYHATTDKDTIINLTNHSYFNLAGTGDILNHQLMINAGQFTPTGPTLIPTGELLDVDDTPMDFRQATAIGLRIKEPYEQLGFVGGYDHNFVLQGLNGQLSLAAQVLEPSSGRVLEILTTQPGLQFYSGNFLDGSLVGKRGAIYNKYAGFCLETQHFPDSPNHANFPSTVLRAGEEFKQVAILRFLVAD